MSTGLEQRQAYDDGPAISTWVRAMRAANWDKKPGPDATIIAALELLGAQVYQVDKMATEASKLRAAGNKDPLRYRDLKVAVQRAEKVEGQTAPYYLAVTAITRSGRRQVTIHLIKQEFDLFHGVTEDGKPVRLYFGANGESQLVVLST